MPRTTVRPGTLDDVEFLCQAMYRTNPDGPLDADAEAAWFDVTRADVAEHVLGKEPDSTTCVIEHDGRPVGRLRLVRTAERHFIAGIQIMPEHQRQGVGTTVITGLLDQARRHGVPLELNVSKRNPDAERLYVRLGFHRYGEDDVDYLMASEVRR